MAGIKHTKNLDLPDDGDDSRLRPSDWNADHQVTGNVDFGSHNLSLGQLTSVATTGTAPLVVASTTAVENLNADMLDGKHVGTSGAAIPALNAANTWSGNQVWTDPGGSGASWSLTFVELYGDGNVYPVYTPSTGGTEPGNPFSMLRGILWVNEYAGWAPGLYLYMDDGYGFTIQEGATATAITADHSVTVYAGMGWRFRTTITIGDTFNGATPAYLALTGACDTSAPYTAHRGGGIQWRHGKGTGASGDDLKGYTFVNADGKLVFDSTAQASHTDAGNAYIDLTNGNAKFADCQGAHKAADGTAGLTATRTFYAAGSSGGAATVLNTVTIKDGLITAWAQA